MQRTKSLSKVFGIALIAAVLIAPILASPAQAKSDFAFAAGCNATVTAGAEIGLYPPMDSAQSSLVAACVFEWNTTNQEVSANFHVEDFDNVIWHNGAARRVTVTATAAGPPTTVTVTDPASATCADLAGFVGSTVSTNFQTLGHGLKASTFIKSRASCVFTINQPFQGTGPAVGAVLVLDNAYTHVVPAGALPSPLGGTTAAGSCVVTDTATQSLAGDVGKSLSGTNIPSYAVISAVTVGTSWTFTAPGGACALAAGVDQQLEIGGTAEAANTRTVRDLVTTYGATSITSTVPRWNAASPNGNIGLRITFQNGNASCVTTYITAIAANNVATVANAETGCAPSGANPILYTIGEQSLTAPLTGDVMLNQQVELDLSPTLVTGSNDCSYEEPEGFGIDGTWTNPGAFDAAPGLFLVLQPDKTQAIAEITFTTSVITYAGYVIQYTTGTFTPTQLNGSPHFSLDFPGTPTSAALCPPSSATAPGLGFALHVPATSGSQSAIQTGIGRASTAQLRSTRPSAAQDGTSTSFGYVVDDSGTPTLPWNSGALATKFVRTCIISTRQVDFKCGQ